MRGSWLLPVIMLLFSSVPGICQTNAYPLGGALPAPQKALLLTAVTHAGEESAGPGAARWNAGVIDGARTKPLEHTFKLKNTTAGTVKVSHLHGSCGCETLFLTKGGTEASEATLTPGEAVEVRVSVALHPGQSGEMHKYAWAYGPDASAPPLASMEIVMTVRPAITFNPDVLDFGSLLVGETKSVDVTVTADADALAGKPIPTPIGSNVAVLVTPDGLETTARHDGKAARARRFRVTLSASAEAGGVSGTVALPPYAPPSLSSASAVLTGTISGTLTAQPRSVFFGSVPLGQGLTREVVLSEATGQRGKALSVTSGSPWLTVHVREMTGANPVLELALKPSAPIGVVQTQVVVVSLSGERLSVPVVGEVVGPGL